MHLLYIHQYFRTPDEPGGNRSYWIAREMVRRGHRVTVITATSGKYPQAGVVDHDGIRTVYVKNEYSNSMSAPRKVLSFVNFIRQAIHAAKNQQDVDLVFATSTPLTVGYIALQLKKKRHWPYVFEVRDLWPRFPIEVGAIRNPMAIKYLKKLERRIYEQSEFVVALSPGMQEGVIEAGTPPEKTAMIPNMSKPDVFFPHEPDPETVAAFGLDLSKFNVIHFGSMGRANGLEYIIRAAKILQDRGDRDIAFWFMGAGATEPVIKQMTRDWGLDNVLFLGRHKMSVVAEVVNCASASITTFRNLPVLRTNSPNKLFDSLSAGKPIIVNSAGWTKDLCEREHCGCYVDPDDPAALADRLQAIKGDKALLQEWAENARRLSLDVFDKRILAAKAADVLEETFRKLQ